MSKLESLRSPPRLFHVGGDVGPRYLAETFRQQFPKLNRCMVTVSVFPDSDRSREIGGGSLHGVPETVQSSFYVIRDLRREHGR